MFDPVNRILAWYNSISRDRGATAVEYALIIGAITVAVGALAFLVGGQVTAWFSRTCATLNQGPC